MIDQLRDLVQAFLRHVDTEDPDHDHRDEQAGIFILGQNRVHMFRAGPEQDLQVLSIDSS
jgi:hypothetical protein